MKTCCKTIIEELITECNLFDRVWINEIRIYQPEMEMIAAKGVSTPNVTHPEGFGKRFYFRLNGEFKDNVNKNKVLQYCDVVHHMYAER